MGFVIIPLRKKGKPYHSHMASGLADIGHISRNHHTVPFVRYIFRKHFFNRITYNGLIRNSLFCVGIILNCLDMALYLDKCTWSKILDQCIDPGSSVCRFIKDHFWIIILQCIVFKLDCQPKRHIVICSEYFCNRAIQCHIIGVSPFQLFFHFFLLFFPNGNVDQISVRT